ncbi:GNAT family N-acetyltransferase [Vibrio sp. M260118]|uniref:GNAT family N-acetyltransferase n=1 Tax=Vibrio sp. M260118 TaxID=3020896 RepID=UPI002F42F033
MHIETLDPIKLPLVSRLYKAHYPSGKAKSDELTIVGTIEHKIVSVVRYRSIEQFRLLTGMLVLPAYRGGGLGHQLMEYCAQHVLAANDFCFSYAHLEGFYAQHGFEVIDVGQLPNPLKSLFDRYSRKKQLVPMQYLQR